MCLTLVLFMCTTLVLFVCTTLVLFMCTTIVLFVCLTIELECIVWSHLGDARLLGVTERGCKQIFLFPPPKFFGSFNK